MDMNTNEINETNEIKEKGLSKVQGFWMEHVVAADDFSGPDFDYCKANGLNHKTFQTYKRKFGFTKRNLGRPKKFFKVEPMPERMHSGSGRPDAKWMAEFVGALLTGQR